MLGTRCTVQKSVSKTAKNGGSDVADLEVSNPEANIDPSGTVSPSRISLQALRSNRTREALLSAAEVIFARDGFEASRVEDIAAAAGRSRGAFYANFESKTEVFLALRTLATRRRARELRDRLMPLQTEEQRFTAAFDYMLGAVHDPNTILLQIEFKLFALRHPEMLADLAAKHLQASTSINMEELSDFFPESDQSAQTHRRHTLAIEAVLEGFALNALFSPGVLDTRYMDQLIPRLLADVLVAFLPSPPNSAAPPAPSDIL
jgi:AcrR family transcriptional regulator